MGLATAAAVILAARGALDTNRSTIEVMHGIGATDEQVTKLFQRRIALDALAGGALGAAAALLVLLLVLGGSTSLVAELAGGTVLRGRDWVLLALLPLAAAVLATVVARTAVTRALRTAL
jgi:cell division transport system permease protein